MRYRVQAAERPDGLYTVWGDTVFAAQRSTEDGTLLLIAPPGEAAPEGFDRDWNGRPARVVLNGEVGATFSLQSYGRFDDEHFQIAPDTAGGELTLRWAGEDAARAAELGLTDFSTTAAPSRLTALWQTRHDFVETPEARPEIGTGDQPPLLRAIGRTLLRVLPPGWQRVGAQFRQVGDYAELEVRSVGDEGNGPVSVSLAAPPELGTLFARLRAAMHQPETGTWFQGTFTLDSESHFDFDFDAEEEPTWRLAPNEGGKPSPRAYATELAIFPRGRKHVPAWLSAKAGLPLDVEFRHAKVADAHNEGERPVVNRPPVPPDMMRGVLDYLFRSPVAVSRPGPQPDIFTPGGPPDVPNAFHTDGVWIWPAAVPHYLRKYGVPPEPELVEHIRAAGFRPPLVGELVRATAEAEIVGKPRPPQTAADLPDESVRTRVERDGEPVRDIRAVAVLDVLYQRLAEHGVAPTAYRIGANAVPEPGLWTLRRAENGWEVSRPPTDEPVAFAKLEEAARFFLGTLLLYPARAAVGANEEADNPADWPILPLRGEPPLTFFRRKRIIVLPAGTTVQRFGNETGNLVHAETARFVETSLAADRERERRLYRVLRPLRAVTGITTPWNGTPGGAVAYVLPRPIAQHLESGALSRVQ